jgi:phage terminase large subunit-like protein
LWTPPLRKLTPETSYGFSVIHFAAVILKEPLDPWEQWLVIHAGELLENGFPRFRVVLVLVARQNGKTTVLKVLSLYWLFIERQKLVLGTSTNRDYAKEAWDNAVTSATNNPLLREEIPRNGIRRANGQEVLATVHGAKYKIAASNRRGGRSLTIHRLVCDELREHDSFEAWNAAVPAMNAVPDAQVYALSNQGDDDSVVLDSLRTPALEYIETGVGDERLGLFEWSSPDNADPEDLHALAQANPNLGRRIMPDALLGAARRAKAAGGKELTGFKTEVMCMRVPIIDPAIDPLAWTLCSSPGDLASYRDKVALCLDVSLDARHATLVAAAKLEDGTVRVEAVQSWTGDDCTKRLRKELPDYVKQVKPRALGWFPGGPAAVVTTDIGDRTQKTDGRSSTSWVPSRTSLVDIKGDVAAVCMEFSQLVSDGLIVHSDDPLLNAHVQSARKLRHGDTWKYTRHGTGPIDGAYALAGAVYLARTLPPPLPPLVVAL